MCQDFLDIQDTHRLSLEWRLGQEQNFHSDWQWRQSNEVCAATQQCCESRMLPEGKSPRHFQTLVPHSHGGQSRGRREGVLSESLVRRDGPELDPPHG